MVKKNYFLIIFYNVTYLGGIAFNKKIVTKKIKIETF